MRLDQRLDGSERVDAPLDDLNRLPDHLSHALREGGIRHRKLHQAAAGIDDVHRPLRAGAEHATNRRGQLSKLGDSSLSIVVANMHLDGVALDRGLAGDADARVAQDAAHVVAQRFHLLPAHVVRIHLQQHV